MIVGKTSNMADLKKLKNSVNELSVLDAVIPGIRNIPCKVCSPFRKDSNPSFSIYSMKGHLYFKDFGTGEHGDLFDLLGRLWGISLPDVIDKVHRMELKNSTIKVSEERSDVSEITHSRAEDIQVVIREWNNRDIEYWASYGITKEWLKYANIHPISYKIITTVDSITGKSYKSTFKCPELAYIFIEKKDNRVQFKIYQPYSTYKWCSTFDHSVISLWTMMPRTGKHIVICSSVKDALCLSCNCRIPAICLQGEGYNMSDTAISELRKRFEKIYICYDVDKAGIEDARKLAEKTGFINIVPDLGTEKDLSDAFKKYGRDWFVNNIKNLFI